MTNRERFVNALTFKATDKIPLSPGHPRESTLAVWHKQGLPESKHYFDHLLEVLCIDSYTYGTNLPLNIDFTLKPWFEEKVLEKKGNHLIVQDWKGNVVEISDQFGLLHLREAKDFVTRRWLKLPVENKQDWEEMMKRYDAASPERLPNDFESICKKSLARDEPMVININGPFWQLREWVGFEQLCMLFIEDPDFVEEMINFWCDFVLAMLERILPHITPDSVHLSEDMAYKAHSMISPEMTRKFLMPVYKKWVSKIKSAGCPIVDMDSDGYIADLIPIWIESGINVCDPIEVAAHNDIVLYRETFRKNMAYVGGIDKRAIAAGGQTIKDEVMRVVPPLLREGGFIPSCDHGVPPDISWPDYVEYSRLLASLTGWL